MLSFIMPLLLSSSVDFVKTVVPDFITGLDANSYFNFLQGLLKMKAPLTILKKDHAFEQSLHDRIPNESQYQCIREFVHVLKIITDAINGLRATEKPTIQLALKYTVQLCDFDRLDGARFSH